MNPLLETIVWFMMTTIILIISFFTHLLQSEFLLKTARENNIIIGLISSCFAHVGFKGTMQFVYISCLLTP